MSAKPILVVGSIAIDWLELPDGRKGEALGGSTTYFLLTASLFAPVHVVGIVGTDFPEEGMELFRQHAAGLKDLQIVEGKTFRWGGRYHADGEERTTLFTELGVFETFKPVLGSENRNRSIVFLGNIQPSLQLDVLKQIRGRQRRVVCDTMNLWINTARDDLMEVLKKTDILLLNESEAELLTGVSDIAEAAHAIMELGPGHVVVKQGPGGAALVNESERVHVDAYPVSPVVDPTGAGDCFAGGFVGALAKGSSLAEAVVAGTATASFCVEGFGIDGLLNIMDNDLVQRMDAVRLRVPKQKII